MRQQTEILEVWDRVEKENPGTVGRELLNKTMDALRGTSAQEIMAALQTRDPKKYTPVLPGEFHVNFTQSRETRK